MTNYELCFNRMTKSQEIARLQQELNEARNREYWAAYRVEQLVRRAPAQPRRNAFSRFIHKWVLCCLPYDPEAEAWIFEPSSRPALKNKKNMELVRMTASEAADPPEPLIPARRVRFAATDGTPTSTSTTSPPTTASSTTGSSITGDESTVPSGGCPVGTPDSPSSVSGSSSGEAASDTSQGTQERRVDSQTAMLANVVDVNLLIGELSLEGTTGPAGFEHSPETALSLLEGCCRASIPQPADSTYNRDLSHAFNPVSPHTPASYPTTELPQFHDPNFFRCLDPACFQDDTWCHGGEDNGAFHYYSEDELQ
ncbi:hypothetical protein BSKO_09672 [Bryopsis sp. KO-2023]|nr:hypothetical protein BSKO_09672 [Bryopsis sp. KO-2023]